MMSTSGDVDVVVPVSGEQVTENGDSDNTQKANAETIQDKALIIETSDLPNEARTEIKEDSLDEDNDSKAVDTEPEKDSINDLKITDEPPPVELKEEKETIQEEEIVPETSKVESVETVPVQKEHETSILKQCETPSSKQHETPSPKQCEISSPKQHETPSPQQRETPSPKQCETPSPKQHETPSPKQKRMKREEPTSETEMKVGTLEEPPMIEDGVKRARKKVQRLSDAIDKSMAEKEDKHAKVPGGSGVPLGEIEYVSHMLKATRPDDLKCLHSIAMGRPGTQARIRVILRQFCGFEFEKGSPEYTKKLNKIISKKSSDLKLVGKIIGLDKVTKPKDELATEVLHFLMKPKDMGRSISDSKSKGRKSKAQKSEGDAKAKPKIKKKKLVSEANDDEEAEEEEEEEEEEETPKKKAKKVIPKKKETKAISKKKPKESKKVVPKKPGKAQKRPAKASAKKTEEVSNRNDSELDEPATKKAKKMPSDEELKKTVLGLLANVDLEKVTMKNVLQQIYEKYEGLDLTHKKEYLKSVVKDILSS